MTPFLEVRDLKKQFPVEKNFWGRPKTFVNAVSGVTFSIGKNETLGLVGESGCGKSTTGRCVLRLIEPTEGEIRLDGVDVRALSPQALRDFRTRMQIVFQDAMSSFDPRSTVGQILTEPMRRHGIHADAPEEAAAALLEEVGLSGSDLSKYPHEFSGGQRQRIAIARALSVQPDFIVCDEPVSALDVSIQAHIINLFLEEREKRGLTYLFISHDLSVVRFISDRICVMYLGRVVEYAPTEEIFWQPLHPYTKALISSIPASHPMLRGHRIGLSGDVPDPIHPPAGCCFHARCPYASARCAAETPEYHQVDDGHFVACHLYENEAKHG